MKTSKEIRLKLAELIETDPDLANLVKVYAFRTYKADLPRTVTITNIGNQPAKRTTGGKSAIYNFSIPIYVAHNGTIEEEARAEDALDDIETAIINLLEANRVTEDWINITYPIESARPVSPSHMQQIRIAEIFISVHPR